MNVDDLVQIRIAEAARRIAADRERRRTQQAARNAGLVRRHAAKLDHFADKESEVPTARIAVCPRCSTERIHRRVAGVHVEGHAHDVLRCTDSRCRLVWCLPAEQPPAGRVRPAVA